MRIALLEDDIDQANLLKAWLEDAQHNVSTYSSAQDLFRALGRESFDVYIMDWELSDEDHGLNVLQRMRGDLKRTEPVLFCTRMNTEDHIVQALGAGADDYLVKPIKRRELLMRIEAVLRRFGKPINSLASLEIPPYVIDRANRTITIFGKPISLTEKEYELALFLFERLGQVVSRSHLLEVVWQRSAEISTRTVDVHLSRLRRKLNFSTETGWVLTSIYQHGYRLSPVVEDVTVN
jgi:two-component system, OmpR family, response regulator RegX3